MTEQEEAFETSDSTAQDSSLLEDLDHSEPLLGPPGSPGYKSEQPLRMNVILGTALPAQIGVWGITLAVWYNVIFRAQWILFSFHPV